MLSTREGLAAELSGRLEDLSQLLSAVENGLAHFLDDVSRDTIIEEEQESDIGDGELIGTSRPTAPPEGFELVTTAQ